MITLIENVFRKCYSEISQSKIMKRENFENRIGNKSGINFRSTENLF